MKTRLLAFLILCCTIIGLFFYFSDELGITGPTKEEKEQQKKELLQQEKKKAFLEKQTIVEKQQLDLPQFEKVKKLREHKKHLKVIEIEDTTFYFDIIGNALVLQVAETQKQIGNFELVLKKNIEIETVYGTDDLFLLTLKEKKYIFSKITGVLVSFDFKLDINYIKKDSFHYIISTEKGVFLLGRKTKKIEYAHIFSDFIIENKNYLAIIDGDDKKRQKKYNLNTKGKDIIFLYNPVSKQEKVVHVSNVSLKKIYKEGKKIFIENYEGERFELKNF